MNFLPQNAADTKSTCVQKGIGQVLLEKNPSRQVYLILKFWTTNSWKLGKFSGERKLHNYPAFRPPKYPALAMKTGQQESSTHGVQPGTLVSFLCVPKGCSLWPAQGEQHPKVCGTHPQQLWDQPGIHSSKTHLVLLLAADMAEGTLVLPLAYVPHFPPHPKASIPPRAIKLKHILVFQLVSPDFPLLSNSCFISRDNLILSAEQQRFLESEHQLQDS